MRLPRQHVDEVLDGGRDGHLRRVVGLREVVGGGGVVVLIRVRLWIATMAQATAQGTGNEARKRERRTRSTLEFYTIKLSGVLHAWWPDNSELMCTQASGMWAR